jgi:hypothetical protein
MWQFFKNSLDSKVIQELYTTGHPVASQQQVVGMANQHTLVQD